MGLYFALHYGTRALWLLTVALYAHYQPPPPAMDVILPALIASACVMTCIRNGYCARYLHVSPLRH